jgi:hypothetical protein
VRWHSRAAEEARALEQRFAHAALDQLLSQLICEGQGMGTTNPPCCCIDTTIDLRNP